MHEAAGALGQELHGILDRVASSEDLPFIFELESWSNDRISTELGILNRIPAEEWVTGRPMASVIMAAFCHPRAGGGRFNGEDRGAWYAGTTLETAHAEAVYHRTKELAEIGVFETRVEMRLYLADFRTDFHDIRARTRLAIPYADVSEQLGYEIDAYSIQHEMSTHYGRMVAGDHELMLFSDPTEAMEHLMG